MALHVLSTFSCRLGTGAPSSCQDVLLLETRRPMQTLSMLLCLLIELQCKFSSVAWFVSGAGSNLLQSQLACCALGIMNPLMKVLSLVYSSLTLSRDIVG